MGGRHADRAWSSWWRWPLVPHSSRDLKVRCQISDLENPGATPGVVQDMRALGVATHGDSLKGWHPIAAAVFLQPEPSLARHASNQMFSRSRTCSAPTPPLARPSLLMICLACHLW